MKPRENFNLKESIVYPDLFTKLTEFKVLGISLKMAKIMIFGLILAANIDTNKHLHRMIYLSALGSYWNTVLLKTIFWLGWSIT